MKATLLALMTLAAISMSAQLTTTFEFQDARPQVWVQSETPNVYDLESAYSDRFKMKLYNGSQEPFLILVTCYEDTVMVVVCANDSIVTEKQKLSVPIDVSSGQDKIVQIKDGIWVVSDVITPRKFTRSPRELCERTDDQKAFKNDVLK